MDVQRLPRLRSPRVAVGLLLLVTALLYARTVHYPYTYEDLNDPPTFAHPWPPASWAVSGHPKTLSAAIPARIMTLWSYAWTHGWTDNAAHGDHAGNVLLHLVNIGLLFLIARKAMAERWALVACAFFALWPTQVEAVAYVSGRADLLVTLGVLLACVGVAYDLWLPTYFGWLFAALSKEIGVVAPALTLLYGWWIGRRWRWTDGLVASVIGAGVVYHLVTIKITHLSLSVVSVHLAQWTQLLFTVLWPVQLSILYDLAWITPTVASLILCGWLLAGWVAQRSRLALFVLLFVLFAILPRLFSTETEPLHLHHLYTASLGLALGLGKAVA